MCRNRQSKADEKSNIFPARRTKKNHQLVITSQSSEPDSTERQSSGRTKIPSPEQRHRWIIYGTTESRNQRNNNSQPDEPKARALNREHSESCRKRGTAPKTALPPVWWQGVLLSSDGEPTELQLFGDNNDSSIELNTFLFSMEAYMCFIIYYFHRNCFI